ncbi:MAG: hypothetical protein EP297_05925 [Gammaproteobacteria bacterium]|nr:MAG: hypothetical protein EP297_05925 [Gammaproteobacteria bacterium]
MKSFWKLGFFSLMTTVAGAAFAHPHEAGSGVATVFFHPHFGLEHFLAIVVVGLLVVRIVKRKS